MLDVLKFDEEGFPQAGNPKVVLMNCLYMIWEALVNYLPTINKDKSCDSSGSGTDCLLKKTLERIKLHLTVLFLVSYLMNTTGWMTAK